MPWTKNDYPNTMKNLEDDVREKAIEIANELVEEGYEDGRAIPIAISRAKEWFDNRGKKVSDDVTHHLKPDGDQWVIKSVSSDDAWIFDSKKEAMEKVKAISDNKQAKIMIHDQDGKFQKNY